MFVSVSGCVLDPMNTVDRTETSADTSEVSWTGVDRRSGFGMLQPAWTCHGRRKHGGLLANIFTDARIFCCPWVCRLQSSTPHMTDAIAKVVQKGLGSLRS